MICFEYQVKFQISTGQLAAHIISGSIVDIVFFNSNYFFSTISNKYFVVSLFVLGSLKVCYVINFTIEECMCLGKFTSTFCL